MANRLTKTQIDGIRTFEGMLPAVVIAKQFGITEADVIAVWDGTYEQRLLAKKFSEDVGPCVRWASFKDKIHIKPNKSLVLIDWNLEAFFGHISDREDGDMDLDIRQMLRDEDGVPFAHWVKITHWSYLSLPD